MKDAQYKLIVDAARERGATFPTQAAWLSFKAAIDAAVEATGQDIVLATTVSHLSLTPRVALEIIGHEAIVQEWYKDSEGIGTWGIGVTNKSGHNVDRYKDRPQSIERILEVYLWLLRAKYIPDVVKAFDGFTLTEAQFAAALSFHYNTGAIRTASWVGKAKAGDMAGAARSIMDWKRPASIVGRRTKERDLFFKGEWSQDGKATVYSVRKPSYSPNWSSARRVDVTGEVNRLLLKSEAA